MVNDAVAQGGAKSRMRRALECLAPWVVGIITFWVASYQFYAPQFEGKALAQGDIAQYAGMSQDIHEHREATGDDPAWTGNMFSGMPAYLIDVEYPTQYIKRGAGVVVKSVESPMNMTLWAMVLMMVAVVLMGVNPWIGIVAGLAYGLSTYFFLIVDAGHITKMWALVYAPPLVAAVWYALRKNMWVGAALAALFGSLELGANHPQITYYFLFACLALWISELWFAVRRGDGRKYAQRTGVLAVAAMLAVASNIAPLWFTMEHQRHTTRGVSEVVDEAAAREKKIAYNTAWSYGVAESFNMVVPNYLGAGSVAVADEVVEILYRPATQQAVYDAAIDDLVAMFNETYEGVRRSDVVYMLEAGDETITGYVEMLYGARMQEVWGYAVNYWGTQPYTAGPTYIGAVVILLAIMSLMLVPRRRTVWIVAVSLVAVLMAWGANAMGLYEVLFDLLPGYKSFRTVSMALVVVEWAAPMLAAYALWRIVCRSCAPKRLVRAALVSLGIVVTLVGVMYVVNDLGVGDIYARLGEAVWVDQLRGAVVEARGAMLLADTLRTLLFVCGAAAVIIAYAYAMLRWRHAYGKVLRGAVVVVVGSLVWWDLAGVAQRYMGEDKWQESMPTDIAPMSADLEIMKDTELGYRVLDLSSDPFNSARASYFHRSVGGYHGAKLGRYQDVIDMYLQGLDGGVLAALNTRYVIDSQGQPTLASAVTGVEPYGAAWFVEDVVRCATPRAELESLGTTPLERCAVVADGVEGLAPHYSTDGDIELVEYAPNYLRYEYEAADDVLAIFSEIYFPDGWSAFVDGEEMAYFCADYILRGMELPHGKHVVEWHFEPPHRGVVFAIMGIASVLIVVCCGAVVVLRRKIKR